jgi:LPPG:FO 2-phospho-L-lactate transferase
MIVAIAGGVGAARFLRGLSGVVDPSDIFAVVNTGDDAVVNGLHVSPDLDTVTYTLAGVVDEARGWGLRDESWEAMAALERLGGETWFRLGDRDIATHLYRTNRLSRGASLSEVAAELASSWGLEQRIVPMSDDPVRTMLTLRDGSEIGFQDYFVRRRHAVEVRSVRFDGAERARSAPGVLGAIASGEVVVVCPSNPVVSIAPVLSVPGVHQALRAARDRTVAVSPIVAGAALKGPADRLLAELGHEVSVVGVARLYADLASALVVDTSDAPLAPAVEREGVRCVVTDTVMSTPEVAAELARTAIEKAL